MRIASLIFPQSTDFSYSNVDYIISALNSRFYKETQGFILPYSALIGIHVSLYAHLEYVIEYQKICIQRLQDNLLPEQWVITGIFNDEDKAYHPCVITQNEVILTSIFQLPQGRLGIIHTYDVPHLTLEDYQGVDGFILIHQLPFLMSETDVYSHTIIQQRAYECYHKFKKPVISTGMIASENEYVWDGYAVFIDYAGVMQEDMSYDDYSILFEVRNGEFNMLFPPQYPVPSESISLYHSAIVQAIRSYALKEWVKKVIIGVSGGIDSALVLTLTQQAIGSNKILALILPGPYTKPESIEDARQICKNLDIEYREISIVGLYNMYKKELGDFLFKDSSTTSQENIQSRIRASIIMGFANEYGGIVLNTSNKSEIALGYSTLYGDAIGALAIIGDLYKTQVYEMAYWINKQALEDIIPQPILLKEPSAELAENQKDSDSLPEYEVLDEIIQQHFVLNISSSEISLNLNIDVALIESIIQRILGMEFKRKQFPPVLKLNRQQGFSFPKLFQGEYLKPRTLKDSEVQCKL